MNWKVIDKPQAENSHQKKNDKDVTGHDKWKKSYNGRIVRLISQENNYTKINTKTLILRNTLSYYNIISLGIIKK